MLAEIKALPRTPGTAEIFAPGEIELGRKADRMEKGIELAQNTYDFLVRKAQEYGIKEQI
jgi:LDH2 family malate/lactate/ureidoglycolate dehydrogenase